MPLTCDLETDIRSLQGKEKGRQEGEHETRCDDIRALINAGMGTPEQLAWC